MIPFPKINLKAESGKQQRKTKLKTSSGPVSQMPTERPKGKRKRKR